MSNSPISEESLSDRFDNVSVGELSNLTDEEARLVDDWTLTQSCLQKLPVQSVSIAADVRRQIEGVRVLVVAPSAPAVASTRQSTFAVLMSSLTIVICLLSLMYIPAPAPNLTFQQSLLSGFTSSEIVSGFSKCDVVLITMADGPEKTNDFLRTSLSSQGVESHSIAIDSKPRANSQLLGSNADSDDVLGALTALDDAKRSEPVDDWQREEILAQLLEAIETPSLAEEHFDDYVVVLPRDVINDMREDSSLIADTDLEQMPVTPSSSEVSAESRKVVFVVRRQKAAASDPVDSNGASLRTGTPTAVDAA